MQFAAFSVELATSRICPQREQMVKEGWPVISAPAVGQGRYCKALTVWGGSSTDHGVPVFNLKHGLICCGNYGAPGI